MPQIITTTNQLTRAQPRMVFFTGSTALAEGYGVCYDRDYGTATASDPLRDHRVALPDNTNNNSFAGVSARSYAAKSGGQWIQIHEPGSVCNVYVDGSVTIADNGFCTCQIGGGGSGTFDVGAQGFMGKGTIRNMQTRTGAGLILAELMDGPESGLIETILPLASTAVQSMLGGVTCLTATTLTAANSTATLANGTFIGQKKRYLCLGTLTTNDYVVTVTAGEQLDGSTDLASMTFDAANEDSMLEWGGQKWRLMHNAGTALA